MCHGEWIVSNDSPPVRHWESRATTPSEPHRSGSRLSLSESTPRERLPQGHPFRRRIPSRCAFGVESWPPAEEFLANAPILSEDT